MQPSRRDTINVGTLNFVHNDDELAYILGHELEHGPSEIQKVIDSGVNRGRSVLLKRATENEVDVKSVLLRVAEENYNPYAGLHVQERFADTFGEGVSDTHSLHASRWDAMAAAITAAKRMFGKIFKPDRPEGYTNEIVTPLKAILELLPSFFEDRKLFRLLLAWLAITSELIHIERLSSIAEPLELRLKVILGALALKLLPKDRRWKHVYESMEKSLPRIKATLVAVPEGYDDSYLVSRDGADDEFARFGVKLAKISPENPKKLLTLRGILSRNGWLRLRALMGSNFRADIAYLFVSRRTDGPADAARTLGCSRDTAYRNWRALEDADAHGLLRLSA